MQLRLTRARGTAAAAAVAALAATAFTLAAPAQPAHAWPGDHNVTVTGKITRCSSPGGIQSMSVRGNLNNQIATWSTQSTSANPTYSLRWTNVPNGSGGNAFYVVHCGVTPDYSGWIHVYQPLVGETLGGINI